MDSDVAVAVGFGLFAIQLFLARVGIDAVLMPRLPAGVPATVRRATRVGLYIIALFAVPIFAWVAVAEVARRLS